MPIPLYGFIAGDTLGLLIFAEPEESLFSLASRLQQSASVRRKPGRAEQLRVVFQDNVLSPEWTVGRAGLTPRDRFIVITVKEDGVS